MWGAEEGEPVDLQLPGEIELRGAVRDEQGHALAQVEVRVDYPFEGVGRATFATTQTDADGRFAFVGLMSGGARLLARCAGFRNAGASVELSDASLAPIELTLERTYAVEGLAVDAAGCAVVGIPIRIEAERVGDEPAASRANGGSFLAGSDAEGRVRFPALSAGAWRASGGSFEWELVGADPPVLRLPGDSMVRLEFRERARPERSALEGEVQLASGGVPVGLEVRGLQGGVLEIDGGRFQATGLVPTRHRIELRAEGQLPLVLPRVDMVPGRTTELGTLVLQPATRVGVLVLDPEERPVRGARARLLPLEETQGGLGASARAVELAHRGAGHYQSEHVARAAWTLQVTHPESQVHRQVVFVEPVDAQQWTVRLVPAE